MFLENTGFREPYGLLHFPTYRFNEYLDAKGLKAKEMLKNNLNVDNTNDAIWHKLMLHSSELGMAGRCLQVMQVSRMRLWWREVKAQSVFWFYSLQNSHSAGRGILFCLLDTLHLLPCAVRQVPPSTLVLAEFWGVLPVNPLQMWYNLHHKSEVRWLTPAAPCWRVARISEASFISSLWATRKVFVELGISDEVQYIYAHYLYYY